MAGGGGVGAPSPSLPSGTRLTTLHRPDSYTIVKFIARGGFGEVYEAEKNDKAPTATVPAAGGGGSAGTGSRLLSGSGAGSSSWSPPSATSSAAPRPPHSSRLAIKVMDVDSDEGWAHENELLQAVQAQKCENLVGLVDFFRDQATGRPCIVMPL